MSKVSVEFDEAEAHEDEKERRRSQRSELTVKIDYMTVDEVFSEFTRDINEGGLFIETDKPCSQGTEVSMHFSLPGSDEAIQTIGRVIRISTGEDGTPRGMGIEFDDLPDDARTKINDLIRALRTGPGSSAN